MTIVYWILMIIFALWIAGVLVAFFEIDNKRGFIMLGILVFFSICVGFVLYFKPLWREDWKLLVLIAEIVYAVVGYAIADE